ncbi:OLC1v1015802C1 [Oldenlandia corymbosa var. corymbosa]|uniref:OLC1v1015802C1 n=1 Tax=Oldenlandia corymbosa var. corymbosa TaxID=529605 RepID=A0AAV1E6Z6_OLDCO|nr:OLC1v1015802C1 [Oldenlandia corymbosa var. corymbosa]
MEEEMVSIEGGNGREIVIVGAGVGGLATALALHRKGFKDVTVYERSASLRVEGTAVGMYANGWRALDQLGVGNQLREKAILLQGTGEFRCLKRKDLVNALASALPPDTIKFGYNVVAMKMNHKTMSPGLQFDDGKVLQPEVLIGCDGSNSKVAEFLGLKPASLFNTLGAVRGLTNYPNGHSLRPTFVRMRRHKRDGTLIGRLPITDKLLYWFVVLSRLDGNFPYDPKLVKQATLEMIKGFPAEAVEMVEMSDLESLSFTHIRYRHPWEILVGKFQQGSVTILGDAMHLMPPFTGQGASFALEDAVILVRNLSNKISSLDQSEGGQQIMSHKNIAGAFEQYVKERRIRILQMSTQTYLIGVILDTKSFLAKLIAIIMLLILFRDQSKHTRYDCGKL